MTIGPEPMTRTCRRSVRLGIGLHQLRESIEQVIRVVRPRCRLRVVLHGEGRRVETPQTLDHVVVETHVADLDGPEPRLDPALPGRVDREAVVVAGDLDLAGGAVEDRLVDAAVAVAELVGAEAQRAAEDLAAEADPEQWNPVR